jgi:hypothetical protein
MGLQPFEEHTMGHNWIQNPDGIVEKDPPAGHRRHLLLHMASDIRSDRQRILDRQFLNSSGTEVTQIFKD